MEFPEVLKEELEVAKQARDELRLQIHLGKAEAKQAFRVAEHKLEEVEGIARRVAHEVEQPLHEMHDSARRLLHEIGIGFKRVKELL